MPTCKNCNARITKFDKDRCPVCGFVNPFNLDNGDTVDITSNISLEKELKKEVKIKKKKIALLLSLFVPFVGTPFYYLKYPKQGLLWLLLNSIVIGVLFLLSYFVLFKNSLLWSILLPLLIAYVFNIALGILLMSKRDYKDGRGELVR